MQIAADGCTREGDPVIESPECGDRRSLHTASTDRRLRRGSHNYCCLSEEGLDLDRYLAYFNSTEQHPADGRSAGPEEVIGKVKMWSRKS
jgi:hypothetical protein